MSDERTFCTASHYVLGWKSYFLHDLIRTNPIGTAGIIGAN